MKKPNISRKTKRKLPGYARVLAQIVFLILAPGAFTTAFAGAKYIFAQIGSGQPLEMTAFVRMLLALCLYTMVFGRFFCGFACPFGAVGDWLHALKVFICQKMKKKAVGRPLSGADPGSPKKQKRSLKALSCPSEIELPDDGEMRVCGDCFQCQKCSAGCPKANVHTGVSKRLRGSELWFIALRAAILFALLRTIA